MELSPDETKLAARYSDSNTPWELFLLDNAPNAKGEQITQSTTAAFKAYPWREAKVITLQSQPTGPMCTPASTSPKNPTAGR